MTNLRTSTTYEPVEDYNEHPTGPSQTVPDQSMTVLELLDRHQRGLPVKQNQNAYYSDDDLPNIKAMDLVDIQEMREELSEQSKYLRKKIKDGQPQNVPGDSDGTTEIQKSGGEQLPTND